MNLASTAFIVFFVYIFINALFYLPVNDLSVESFAIFLLSTTLFFLLAILGSALDRFKTSRLKLSWVVFLFCLLSYLAVVAYLITKHQIDLFSAFEGFNFQKSESIRSSIYSESGFILLFLEYSPIIIVLYLFQKNLLFGCISFFAIAYVFSAFGSRGHVINLLIVLVMFFYYNNNIRVKFWFFPIVILAGIGSITLLTFIKIGAQDLSDLSRVADAVIHRMNLGYVQLVQVIEYTNKEGFEYGWSYIRDIVSLLPGPDYGTNKYLSVQIYGTELYGNLTPTILGESYLNFGFFSVFVLFLYGFSILKVDKFLRSTNEFSEFYLLIALFLVKFVVNGFSGVLPIAVFAVIIFFFLSLQAILKKAL